MFISDDEIAQRVETPKNLANRDTSTPRRTLINHAEREHARDIQPDISNPEDSTVIAPINNGGRRLGDMNLTDEVRSIVGSLARFDTAQNISENFGVSPHHVHELKHGMHSTAQGQDANLTASINANLKQPHDIAVQKLTAVLMGIDTTRISRKKPEKAVQIASGLARIAQQTNPIARTSSQDSDGNAEPAVRLVVYAPVIKQENHYESVHAVTPVRSDR